ncbi:MAG TPA: MXAN_5187 C-terminal domain-containing protein [Vicinamibacterales bacterium]|nr:MXAN_5187 C-terminal domain-containing protein [Vicinamibacterales bacterium]
MPDERVDLARELTMLEGELKRLEAEYNMFFAGRLPRPPWETRGRVDAMVKRLDRSHISNTGDRFRFSTLQSRFQTFADLWERGLRAREEGRPGPFAQPQRAEPAKPQRPEDKILHVTTFSDPLKQMDKLHDLYESIAEARRQSGEEPVPFHKFADLIKTQVAGLKEKGSPEVAFRVAMKDGKVNFTARALKGVR